MASEILITLSITTCLVTKRGMGVETEGESNNYGIVELNICFMGSYVGEV